MRVFIGCDHAGFSAKDEVIDILEQLQASYEDLGAYEFDENDDYPIIAKKVSKKVVETKDSMGILICGSGTGMSIASNKVNGIRAVVGFDSYEAKLARSDENANILCLRSREFDHSKYYGIIKAFLETNFSNEKRHIRRMNQLEGIQDEQN